MKALKQPPLSYLIYSIGTVFICAIRQSGDFRKRQNTSSGFYLRHHLLQGFLKRYKMCCYAGEVWRLGFVGSLRLQLVYSRPRKSIIGEPPRLPN